MKNCLYCIDVYTVSEGDTLYSIAEKYELPVSLLMKVNGIENPYNLQIGTRLCIPGTADQLPAAPESCAKKHTVRHPVLNRQNAQCQARRAHAREPAYRPVQHVGRH